MAKTVAGITTDYLYDRDNVAQELSRGSMLSNWLTGGTDEIFTGTDSTGQANFLRDGLGSTLALTNSSGGNIITYAYEPFGKTTVTSGSSTNEFQYTGRENDGTGLYFNRARYYHPGFQRFVSEDPIGWRGGINLAAYVRNSPTNLKDPTGLDGGGGGGVSSNSLFSDNICLLISAGLTYGSIAMLPVSGTEAADFVGDVLNGLGGEMGEQGVCPQATRPISQTCDKYTVPLAVGGRREFCGRRVRCGCGSRRSR